ncbi:MAG: hypothetical protein HN487_10220 [Flavobacterium sp.]|jgi:hypothetical protein|nr:hypothetical protein [Flavobacterium sp.]
MNFNFNKDTLQKLLISTGIGTLLFMVSYDFGMFWDNVLFASKMGNEIYSNGFSDWTMPDDFDPGHPPFLGVVLAFFWKIFGHSLWVSHLAMLPFIIGSVYQLQRFTSYFVTNKIMMLLGLLLVLADPTLLASFVLVNPETIIVFFFFLALNGILYKEKKWQFIGLFFLSIITFRSMMLFAGLFLFEVLNNYFFNKKSFREILHIKFLSFYFLAALPGIVFVLWRLATKGWLQTHPASPWADLWHLPSINQFLKNIAILIHRYLDFGRVFIFIFLIAGLFSFRKKVLINKHFKQLLLLSICAVFFIIVTVLFSTNAFGHRYFIVSYISFILSAFLVLKELKKYSKPLYVLLFIGLITGNLWIYPERTSQGWDASLAHTPYHSLRKEAINSLDTMNIDISEVASFFPNYNKIDEIDLNGNQKSFTKFTNRSNYVFYSNVYNLSSKDYELLAQNYTEIKCLKKANIIVSILKKRSLGN